MAQLPYSNSIQFYGRIANLKNKEKTVKQVLLNIINDKGLRTGFIEINLISDEALLKINNDALNHNYYTDIITFDYNEGIIISGDIYISVDRVKENAKKYQTTIFDELLRVICHGVLHLTGYNDKTVQDKLKMTKMENTYIALYKNLDVPRGTKHSKEIINK